MDICLLCSHWVDEDDLVRLEDDQIAHRECVEAAGESALEAAN